MSGGLVSGDVSIQRVLGAATVSRTTIILASLLALPMALHAGEPAKLPSINERLKLDVASASPLTLRFKGSTAEEAHAWQKDFSAKLKSLLGPHAPPAKWKTEVISVKEFDDYRREELLLTAEGHPPLPMYLLLPRPKKGKRAAILAIHGHGALLAITPSPGGDDLPGVDNAIKNNHYDYGRQLVKQGYVVAVPCLTPFGDRLGKGAGKQDACGDTFIRMQLLGKTLMAENLRVAFGRWNCWPATRKSMRIGSAASVCRWEAG